MNERLQKEGYVQDSGGNRAVVPKLNTGTFFSDGVLINGPAVRYFPSALNSLPYPARCFR